MQEAALCTLHQRMALCCVITLDRNSLAKFNVNQAMTLSSLLPFFITALEESGTRSQLVLTIQSYHGQTAQVSAMNFSYNCTCCLRALGLYKKMLRNKLQQCWSKCVLNFYCFFVTVFFFFFLISKLHSKSNSFQYKPEGREAYIQGAYNRMHFYAIFLHVDGPTLERRGAYKTTEMQAF